ncbi:TcfC E-set like domain-containing protein [Vibrio metschnikovii]|uniref:TcfC E-set like domain-containing protein n=1 Tax=Vibrio metschnikovii TaxID=28172 RepID=UPI001648969D|nr:TcfC E-set like domain-containing protein [Vibrio metschnikovii]MBC3619225.1 TcfC E-set like domain-containing protein [Vibrio metschnikovii]
MKKKSSAFIISVLAMCFIRAQAQVPESFKSLYDFKEKRVRFSTLNDKSDSYIILSTNYNTIRLSNKNKGESKYEIEQYLEESSLNSEIITIILADLENGVSSDNSCRGKLSECVVIPEVYSFVYDYDEDYLRLFVNAKYFNKNNNVEKVYANPENKSNALINSNDIYFSSYNDQDYNYTINNKSLLGLSLGHITADLSYSNSESSKGLDIKELSYDISVDNTRLYLGQFKNDVRFNSTDFLSTNTRYQQTSANFGSSKNLLIGERGAYDKLFYYAPTNGELLIYRDDRIIKQMNIGEGQGFISYDELPSGRYEVRVEVVVAGQIISSEVVQIYNSSRDTLAVGDFDYLISSGVFNSNSYGQSTYADYFEGKFFTKGLLASRVLRPLTVGVGGLYSDGEWAAISGTQIYLPYQFTLEMSFNYFNNGSYHFDSNLGNGVFSLRNENFSTGNDNGNLAQFVYSDGKYSRTSLSGNYRFSNGIYIYSIISKGTQTILDSLGGGQDTYSYWSATSGFNIPLKHGINLGISIDYQDSDNSLNTQMNLSVPLGSGYSSSSLLAFNTKSLNQIRNSINKTDVFTSKEINSNLSIAQNYYVREEDKNTIDMVLTANTKQENWQGSAYTYVDSTGEKRGVSGSLSSNQMFYGNNIVWTSDKSDAYGVIEVDSSESEQDTYGYVTVRKNGKLQNKSFIYEKRTLYPLNIYNEYDINIDTESVSLINLGESKINEFVKPGSVVKLEPNLKNILSFVSSFDDVMGHKVKDIVCKGLGCHHVQKITDGVFQISLMDGLDFELYSDDNICIIPESKISRDLMNYGRNHCIPNIQPMDNVLVNINNEERSLYFIGLFENDFITDDMLKIIGNDRSSIVKDMGKFKAVYILSEESDLDYAKLGLNNKYLDIVKVKGIQELSIKDLSLSSIKSKN